MKKSRLPLVLFLVALLGAACGSLCAQTPTPQPPRPTSTPYSGDLSIFEYPERDQKLQPNRVMDLLHITPGKSVADIGAGSGWFTVRAARRVGSKGTVFAEDINPKAITFIQDRAHTENLGNIRTILGTPDEAKLPPHAVNAVVLLKVYHEIAHPIPFMRDLRASLAPHARIGIIDRNGNGTDHGLNRDIVEREMAEAGFRKVGLYDFTKADGEDYFLIFEAK
jgi:predicted methyltransferase